MVLRRSIRDVTPPPYEPLGADRPSLPPPDRPWGAQAPITPLGGDRKIPGIAGIEAVVTSIGAIATAITVAVQDQVVASQLRTRSMERATDAAESALRLQVAGAEESKRLIQESLSRDDAQLNQLVSEHRAREEAKDREERRRKPSVRPEGEDLPGDGKGGSPSGGGGEGGGDAPFRVSPAGSGGMEDVTSESSPRARPSKDPLTEFDESRRILNDGNQFTLAKIRKRVGESIQQRVSEWEPALPEGYEQTSDGSWYSTMADGFGKIEDPASEPALRSFMRREQTLGGIKKIASGVAEGQPVGRAIVGALPANAARMLGYGGAAIWAGNKALSAAEDQREKNRAYQSVLGGDNKEGFGERTRESLWALSNRGTIGGDNARQISQQALRIYGDDRGARDEAQMFAKNAMMQFGMSVSSSMKLVEAAAKSGGSSLAGLTKSLERVTEGARSAGISADVMQQKFTQNYESMGSIASGSTQIALAETMTTNQAQMGRRLGQLDYSDQFSGNNMLIQAARAGMSPGDWTTMLNTPEGASVAAQMQYEVQRETMDTQVSPEIRDHIEQRVTEAGGWEALEGDPNNPIWRNLGQEISNKDLFGANAVDPYLAQTVLTGRGAAPGYLQATDTAEYIARHYGGGEEQSRAVERRMEDAQARDINMDASGNALPEGERNMDAWDESMDNIRLDRATWADGGEERTSLDSRDATHVAHRNNLFRKESVHVDNVKRAYSRRLLAGEDILPAVEEILGSGSLTKNTKVQVSVKNEDGTSGVREVSMQEAIEHFSDQLQRGTAAIEFDKDQGFTEIGGQFVTQADYEGDNSAGATSEEARNLGTAVDASRIDAASGQRVVVEPTEELRRWIRVADAESGSNPYDYTGQPHPANPVPGRP